MHIRTNTHTTHSVEIDGLDVPLDWRPYDEQSILAHREADRLFVAYLVHDTDGSSNPMENGDCQGTIITHRTGHRGLISDNEQDLYAALGLSGGRWSDPFPNIDHAFAVEPYIDHRGLRQTTITLRDIAAARLFEHLKNDDALLADWVAKFYGEEHDILSRMDTFWDSISMVTALKRDLLDGDGDLNDEVELGANALFVKRWREVVGPFTVTMNYSGYNDTTITPTEWDGDHDDLPNCVWVADPGAIENILASVRPDNVEVKQVVPYPAGLWAVTVDGAEKMRGTLGECTVWVKVNYPPTPEMIAATARRYGAAVCEEYAKWCSGEVFGVVFESFELKNDTEWVSLGGTDSCWGHIGYSYAMETLTAEHNALITSIKEAA